MLHPSYTDLINAVNSGAEENADVPTINSRYSIVIAASRRARQLIDEKEKKGNNLCYKPLSVAVDEIHKGDVKIVSEDDIPEDEIDLNRDAMADMYEEEVVLAEDTTDAEDDVLEETVEAAQKEMMEEEAEEVTE